MFIVNTVSPISVKQLDTIIGDLKHNKIYLSKSDKIGQNIILFNESIVDNSGNMNEQLDFDSWFDEDAESSMIFIFMSCIIGHLAFILLVFLCFKHEQLRKLISLYMASPQVVNAAALNIPITRLSVHETDHNAYYLVSGNWFYFFIKLSQPII